MAWLRKLSHGRRGRLPCARRLKHFPRQQKQIPRFARNDNSRRILHILSCHHGRAPAREGSAFPTFSAACSRGPSWTARTWPIVPTMPTRLRSKAGMVGAWGLDEDAPPPSLFHGLLDWRCSDRVARKAPLAGRALIAWREKLRWQAELQSSLSTFESWEILLRALSSVRTPSQSPSLLGGLHSGVTGSQH